MVSIWNRGGSLSLASPPPHDDVNEDARVNAAAGTAPPWPWPAMLAVPDSDELSMVGRLRGSSSTSNAVCIQSRPLLLLLLKSGCA